MSVIDDFFANVNEPQRTELERIRQVIHAAVPDATEVISYGMPGFKYKDKYMVGFNAFKDHLSLFPTSEPVAYFKGQLKDYKLARGTIQFTLDHPLPDALITAIVQRQAANIANR